MVIETTAVVPSTDHQAWKLSPRTEELVIQYLKERLKYTDDKRQANMDRKTHLIVLYTETLERVPDDNGQEANLAQLKQQLDAQIVPVEAEIHKPDEHFQLIKSTLDAKEAMRRERRMLEDAEKARVFNYKKIPVTDLETMEIDYNRVQLKETPGAPVFELALEGVSAGEVALEAVKGVVQFLRKFGVDKTKTIMREWGGHRRDHDDCRRSRFYHEDHDDRHGSRHYSEDNNDSDEHHSRENKHHLNWQALCPARVSIRSLLSPNGDVTYSIKASEGSSLLEARGVGWAMAVYSRTFIEDPQVLKHKTNHTLPKDSKDDCRIHGCQLVRDPCMATLTIFHDMGQGKVTFKHRGFHNHLKPTTIRPDYKAQAHLVKTAPEVLPKRLAVELQHDLPSPRERSLIVVSILFGKTIKYYERHFLVLLESWPYQTLDEFVEGFVVKRTDTELTKIKVEPTTSIEQH
ncbi:hypothetical protein BGZ65_004652 [Modicella reniformis]|uniref:Uncharacterized protein n=1 Tax=Modicella reniformis TaxID=1440133 RepID=A0A9P6SV72_9FUNG|nr:hypothetical protein BGZ65_004652 [Modicella reniformis]